MAWINETWQRVCGKPELWRHTFTDRNGVVICSEIVDRLPMKNHDLDPKAYGIDGEDSRTERDMLGEKKSLLDE